MDDQEETLAAVVAQRRWVHVDHVTDPGLSGRKMTHRKGLLDALDGLDRGDADVLVASKVDRVARSTTDFARLLERGEGKGWKVVVLDVDVDTTTAAGRVVVEVVSAAAAFESRRIGERVKATHAIRKAQGKRAGQPPMLSQKTRDRIVTDRARVLVLAQDEELPPHHEFIGTEHILLGLIHEGDGLAAKKLQLLGVDLEMARARVVEMIGRSGSAPTGSPSLRGRSPL